ncbi:MAG: hypothetical protein HY692_00245, partial [Cyanobacteria bacterium NC_groundwater_1444_Ag_S-0.65um_54_12]|nr:hypothetical protein [Cyanobacteria bacterium NC_groundwater_1444_Ag_S-0.65um_54_12]
MKRHKYGTLPRVLAAFIAGSLVGCAPAGLVRQLTTPGIKGVSSAPVPDQAMGRITFTLRWPGVQTRRVQAIPGAATAVVAFVWADAERTKVAAVHTFHKEDGKTVYNERTGRYESRGEFYLPPGDGYVLELRAYDQDPLYREVFGEITAATELVCGPELEPEADEASESLAATSSPPASESVEATSSAEASESVIATTSAQPATGSIAPCTVTAKLLSSGSSSPFSIKPGHITPLRVLLSAIDGPVITSVTPALLSPEGSTVRIAGSGFGTDVNKIRATLVPAYQGWGMPRDLGSPVLQGGGDLAVQIPKDAAFSGTLYLFVDGIEARVASASNAAIRVVRKLYIDSNNLKFDLSSCPGCQPNATNKV